MARFTCSLDHVRIAAPCSADWDAMIGTDRVRFCGHCKLNVYNLSEMNNLEAEAFISRNEERLCVRYYRRADGSILTRTCPVGIKAIRSRLSRISQALSALVLSFFAGLGFHTVVTDALAPDYTMGTIRESLSMGAMVPAKELDTTTIERAGMGRFSVNTTAYPRPLAGRVSKSRRK